MSAFSFLSVASTATLAMAGTATVIAAANYLGKRHQSTVDDDYRQQAIDAVSEAIATITPEDQATIRHAVADAFAGKRHLQNARLVRVEATFTQHTADEWHNELRIAVLDLQHQQVKILRAERTMKLTELPSYVRQAFYTEALRESTFLLVS